VKHNTLNLAGTRCLQEYDVLETVMLLAKELPECCMQHGLRRLLFSQQSAGCCPAAVS
jgi:hypothetical protein